MSTTLIRAVEADCLKLITSFKEKRSYCFRDFLDSWKECEFDLIYAGRHNDVNYFFNLLSQCAKKYCIYTKLGGIYQVVGGIYLLYGIYYTQPLKDKVRLRLTSGEYEAMENNVKIIMVSHKEPAYCFYKLIHDSAIHFVITMSPCDEFYIHQGAKDTNEYELNSEDKKRIETLNSLVSTLDLSKSGFNSWEAQYNKFKKKFNKISPYQFELRSLEKSLLTSYVKDLGILANQPQS